MGGSADGKAWLPTDCRLNLRCPHSGLLPGGDREACRSSSLRAGSRERSREWGGGPALPRAGSFEFRPGLLCLLAPLSQRRRTPEEGIAGEPVECHSSQPRRPGRRRRSPAPGRSSGTPRAVAQTTRLRRPVCPQTDSFALLRSGLRQGGQAKGKRPPSGSEA